MSKPKWQDVVVELEKNERTPCGWIIACPKVDSDDKIIGFSGGNYTRKITCDECPAGDTNELMTEQEAKDWWRDRVRKSWEVDSKKKKEIDALWAGIFDIANRACINGQCPFCHCGESEWMLPESHYMDWDNHDKDCHLATLGRMLDNLNKEGEK